MLGLFSCFQVMIMSHKDAGNLFVQTAAILIWQLMTSKNFPIRMQNFAFHRQFGSNKLLSNSWLKVNISQGGCKSTLDIVTTRE